MPNDNIFDRQDPPPPKRQGWWGWIRSWFQRSPQPQDLDSDSDPDLHLFPSNTPSGDWGSLNLDLAPVPADSNQLSPRSPSSPRRPWGKFSHLSDERYYGRKGARRAAACQLGVLPYLLMAFLPPKDNHSAWDEVQDINFLGQLLGLRQLFDDAGPGPFLDIMVIIKVLLQILAHLVQILASILLSTPVTACFLYCSAHKLYCSLCDSLCAADPNNQDQYQLALPPTDTDKAEQSHLSSLTALMRDIVIEKKYRLSWTQYSIIAFLHTLYAAANWIYCKATYWTLSGEARALLLDFALPMQAYFNEKANYCGLVANLLLNQYFFQETVLSIFHAWNHAVLAKKYMSTPTRFREHVDHFLFHLVQFLFALSAVIPFMALTLDEKLDPKLRVWVIICALPVYQTLNLVAMKPLVSAATILCNWFFNGIGITQQREERVQAQGMLSPEAQDYLLNQCFEEIGPYLNKEQHSIPINQSKLVEWESKTIYKYMKMLSPALTTLNSPEPGALSLKPRIKHLLQFTVVLATASSVLWPYFLISTAAVHERSPAWLAGNLYEEHAAVRTIAFPFFLPFSLTVIKTALKNSARVLNALKHFLNLALYSLSDPTAVSDMPTHLLPLPSRVGLICIDLIYGAALYITVIVAAASAGTIYYLLDKYGLLNLITKLAALSITVLFNGSGLEKIVKAPYNWLESKILFYNRETELSIREHFKEEIQFLARGNVRLMQHFFPTPHSLPLDTDSNYGAVSNGLNSRAT